jgi:phosphate transport system permease protein
MTDLAERPAPAFDLTSEAATRRLAKRYRAEARFRFYGVLGLVLTGVFIVVLLLDVAIKGMPAFWQHSLTLSLSLDPAKLGITSPGDPKAFARADFNQPVREALLEKFPDVTTRARRKLLLGLVSTGAADDLRALALSDSSLLGRRIVFRALMSDEADLYLKGDGAEISAAPARVAATLNALGEEGRFEVIAAAEAFATHLTEIKRRLAGRALALEIEAKALLSARADVERLIRASGEADTAVTARLRSNLKSLDLKIAELQAQAAALRARASQTQALEKLDPSLPSILVAVNGGVIKADEISSNRIAGERLIAPRTLAPAAAGEWRVVTYQTPEAARQVSDQEVAWLESLKGQGLVAHHFNTRFFTSGDSREPELAGIRGALMGSFLTLLVTLVLCLPVGVAAAVYLEEFAPRNRITEIIEVNINNLAAVPSIVFGLLGLALFLNTLGLPRSAALVGGLVLALLVLPTIIIASRAALKAVPPSIREAALAIGASHQQAVFHHVLPLAMPGIMTGTIIGMAHALGETAPLLMIGMVAFIVDIPGGVTDSATVLPVQIYLWSDLPERAFEAKTAAAILVLLAFLFLMNGLAILLRRRFERRW